MASLHMFASRARRHDACHREARGRRADRRKTRAGRAVPLRKAAVRRVRVPPGVSISRLARFTND